MRNRGCFVTVDLTNSVDSGRYRPAAATAAGSEAVVEVLAASGGDRRASFFVTGACARELPAVVFSLAGRGHEIACHGGRLEAAFASDRAAFTAVLARSLAALEDIANQRIIGYRTAEPLSPADRATPLEALADCGIAYYSSVIGTKPRAANTPFDGYAFGNRTVYEFPLRRASLPGGLGIMAIGPAAFRHLPVAAILKLMRDASAAGYAPVIRLDAGRIGARHKARLAAILDCFPNRGPMAEAVPGLASVADLRRAALRLVA